MCEALDDMKRLKSKLTTMTTSNTWQERFEEAIYPFGCYEGAPSGYKKRLDRMLNFIEQELERAKKEAAEEAIDAVEARYADSLGTVNRPLVAWLRSRFLNLNNDD